MESFREKNCVITRDWRTEVQLKTFLSEYHEGREARETEQHAGGQSLDTEGLVVIDLEDEGEGRWAMMKRNASIREAKEIIRGHIESCPQDVSFARIFGSFAECDSLVSPALCFLTVLHLANEHNYSLEQLQGEFNFLIRRN